MYIESYEFIKSVLEGVVGLNPCMNECMYMLLKWKRFEMMMG